MWCPPRPHAPCYAPPLTAEVHAHAARRVPLQAPRRTNPPHAPMDCVEPFALLPLQWLPWLQLWMVNAGSSVLPHPPLSAWRAACELALAAARRLLATWLRLAVCAWAQCFTQTRMRRHGYKKLFVHTVRIRDGVRRITRVCVRP